jgi:hypothetical protein
VRRRTILLLLPLAVCLAATACGGADAPPSPPASAGSAPPSVLDFDAPLLDGGTFHGASLAGKDVAFWFWAPW